MLVRLSEIPYECDVPLTTETAKTGTKIRCLELLWLGSGRLWLSITRQ